jgi:hypothetical protein
MPDEETRLTTIGTGTMIPGWGGLGGGTRSGILWGTSRAESNVRLWLRGILTRRVSEGRQKRAIAKPPNQGSTRRTTKTRHC